MRVSSFTIVAPSVAFTGRVYTGIAIGNGGSAIIDNNLVTADTTNPITGLQNGRGINVDGASARDGSRQRHHPVPEDGCTRGGNRHVRYHRQQHRHRRWTHSAAGPERIQISGGADAIVRGKRRHRQRVHQRRSGVATGILLFLPGVVCVEFNDLSGNNVGLYVLAVGSLVQANNSTNNLQYGIVADVASHDNVFIRNVALGNPTFDIADFSMGFMTAMTANTYLCNTCETDNKDGELCGASTTVPVPFISTTDILAAIYSDATVPAASPDSP